MSNNKLITPRKLSGFMELMPHKQVLMDNKIDALKSVFKKACFVPLDTPVLEYTEVLLAKSGGEIDKEVYHFVKGDTDICMRYDLTVPLARFVASNYSSLSFPFKRYQIGKVFRGERPQKGRFREFIQCDADIVGDGDLPICADGECIKLIEDCFDALGQDVLIQISNRNVLFGYVESLGYKDKVYDVLVLLDKMDKVGKDNTFLALVELGLDKQDSQSLVDLASKKGDFEDVLQEIKGLTDNEVFQKGVNDLFALSQVVKSLEIEDSKYILNLGIIRGQNYYTGTIFEAVIPSHPEFGTVCGGGRYDNLAGYFTDKKLPGVGMSIGFTRLFDLLDQNDMLGQAPLSPAQLEIIPLGQTLLDCFTLANFFKRNQIRCEVNYEERSFKAKLKDAGKKGVPFVLIVGENEVASKTYALRNMYEGVQEQLNKEKCLEHITKFLNKK